MTVGKSGQQAYVELPNDVDKGTAISKLQNRKATGHDQIPAELIKEGGKEHKKVIYELSSKIWEEEIISHGWKYGIICQIQKKGDVITSDIYTAVTLLHMTYKILANILYVKLISYA